MSAFLNPTLLPIAIGLISVPIIIHLINRLRFKRIAWAAMEFLLKAQKRNRRRLIIEQLLLLALRCLLVALVGVLVMRFVGVSFGDMGVKQSVHIVLLDDSLSMNDRWKKGEIYTTAFEVARDDILFGKIAKKLSESKNPEQLIVLPLSAALALDDKDLKVYDKLNIGSELEGLKKELSGLTATKLSLNLLDGVKRARKLAEADSKSIVTFHVLSDFRKNDWGVEDSAALYKELIEFAKQRKVQINLLDTVADPGRTPSQSAPPAHDNIGIIDLKPRSRMAGKNMPVTFTLSVANFGPETEVDVDIFDINTGMQQLQVDFMPPGKLKLKPKEITQATFEITFSPKIADNESYFAAISAHLRGMLDKDGLPQDNVCYGVVEVRNQVPVLIVDGEGKAGYEDLRKGRDSFFLNQAYRSVPGASTDAVGVEGNEAIRPFRIDLPYKKGVIDAMSVLEQGDLRQYPTIILANVPQFNTKQLENLEKFVHDGGGLGIFMGPLVNTQFYNKSLYKNGQGIFPVELKETFYPAEKKARLAPQYLKGVPMLLLRDDDPKLRPLPIFGTIFTAPEQRELLDLLPVYRYFQVASRPWLNDTDKDARRVLELATLPNDRPVDTYQYDVMNIVRNREAGEKSKLVDLLDKEKYRKYAAAFEPYRERLRSLVELNKERPYFLAQELEKMLKDRGTGANASANLEEFWSNADPEVQSLHNDVKALLNRVRYLDGAPFILASSYGKGKVVTVMSTAGNLWADWVGGNPATTVFQPFIWEMQNYLSTQGSDINLTVGKSLEINVNTEPFDVKPDVEMFRYMMKEVKEKPFIRFGGETTKQSGKQVKFVYPNTKEPGVYIAELYGAKNKKTDSEVKEKETKKEAKEKDTDTRPKGLDLLTASASVFNLDTVREGNLERVAYDVIKVNILDKAEKRIQFTGVEVSGGDIAPSILKDLSEMPVLFLAILSVLVLEQALAVHLSFHVKSNETFIPAGQPRPTAV